MGVYPQAVLATLLVVANICVNVPVIVLHFQSPSMRDDMVAKVMASLCVSDLWLGSVLPAISGAVAWINPETVPAWVVTVQGFIATAFTACSHWHFALLAIFRCCVVVRPLTYFRVFTDKSMTVMLVSIHVVSVSLELIAILSGLSFGFDRDVFLPYVSNSKGYTISWLCVTFGSTCLIILVCYLKVFLVVRHQVRLVHPMRSGIRLSGEIGGPAGGTGTEVRGTKGVGGGGGSEGAQQEGDGRGRGGRGGKGVGCGGGSGGTELERGRGGEGGGTRGRGEGTRVGSCSTLGLFAASVRSARNLFIISVVYLMSYLPGVVAVSSDRVPLWFRFASKWLYLYASLGNGLLYVVLHKTVRRQLAKLITRWRLAAAN